MTKFLLPVMFFVLTTTTTSQKCSNDDFSSMCEVKAAVIRLLSYPAYTGWDEKILNRAGDAAALALMRSLSMEDLNSSEKERQTLLILKLAFEAPQLIAVNTDRRPTAAMLLLGYISKTNYGKGYSTEIENTRIEIEHNTSTGKPAEFATLEGDAPFDSAHTEWVASVLRWTCDIKPGMTRRNLLRVYAAEGGLSTRTQRTYVLKGCPYIKVDVKFLPVGDVQDGLTQQPNDKIREISKPYLDYSIMD
ncbi:MAG TPA: hypothetical protein VH140_16230 [Candidatus Acidoferrum sp.]|nr:hypothetical protein [Candidatus Acidoferrum sp.]